MKAKKNCNDDCPRAKEFPIRIQPGEYNAICHKTELGTAHGGVRKIYLRFRICEGEYDGVDLFMTCTFPPKREMSLRHKYYEQWMIANGGPPHPKQRLTRDVFLNRIFQVVVRDTNRLFSNGRRRPDALQYSVVDSIIEPMTGGPRQ